MYKRSLWIAGLLAVASAGCARSDSADSEKVSQLSDRVEKLEAKVAKLDEIEEFLRPIMAQQKAQEQEKAATEPDPAARFAVDITGNPYIGPADAPVTIVEAFDFA